MAIPSADISTLQPQLQTFYEASFEQLTQDYVGTRVFPVTNVQVPTGRFGVVRLEDLLKAPQTLTRASGSGYMRDIMQFADLSYQTVEYGIEEVVDEREMNMYQELLPAAELATRRSALQVLMAQEVRVAALLTDSSFYTGSFAQALGASTWNVTTSTPIIDVENAVKKAYSNCGLWPNAIIMSREVFRTLRIHPTITAAISSTGAGDQSRMADVTTQQLSQVFDLPNVIVAGGTKNTAGVGSAATIAQIWPKSVWIGRIAETQDMREACVGRTFHWGGDGSQPLGTVDAYYEQSMRANFVRVRHEVDNKRIYPEVGVMIASAIA